LPSIVVDARPKDADSNLIAKQHRPSAIWLQNAIIRAYFACVTR
jgi:hypothetical protein